MELATLLYTDETDGILIISEYDNWRLHFGKNALFLICHLKDR
jgi:hypothetical protein